MSSETQGALVIITFYTLAVLAFGVLLGMQVA